MSMITREDKSTEIAALSERFGRAKAAFLVDFKGMTVEQVTLLRKKLVPVDSEMKVVRNTLAVRALKDHPASESAIKDSFIESSVKRSLARAVPRSSSSPGIEIRTDAQCGPVWFRPCSWSTTRQTRRFLSA